MSAAAVLIVSDAVGDRREHVVELELAACDGVGEVRSGTLAEQLDGQRRGLGAGAEVCDLFDDPLERVRHVLARLGQRADADLETGEHGLGVDAGLVELGQQGERVVEAEPEIAERRTELDDGGRELVDAGARCLPGTVELVQCRGLVLCGQAPVTEHAGDVVDVGADIGLGQPRQVDELLGEVLERLAGQTEPGVQIGDRSAGVVEAGRHALEDVLECAFEPDQGVTRRAGPDADLVELLVEGVAELRQPSDRADPDESPRQADLEGTAHDAARGAAGRGSRAGDGLRHRGLSTPHGGDDGQRCVPDIGPCHRHLLGDLACLDAAVSFSSASLRRGDFPHVRGGPLDGPARARARRMRLRRLLLGARLDHAEVVEELRLDRPVRLPVAG